MSENSVFEPAPEHEWLTHLVGTWDVQCAYHTVPGEEPLEVEGHEVVDSLGPFWIVGRFDADMLGTPIIGQAVTGFDPVKRLFIGTWKDSYTPFHYTFEGKLSDDEKVLLLTGENYDPMRQRVSTYRSCTEYHGDSKRVLKLSVLVDEEDVPILEYRYTRK